MGSVQVWYDPEVVSWWSIARIELTVPRRWQMWDLNQTPNFYQDDLTIIPRNLIDQKLELRVSVLPSDKSIFEKNPVLFLFRETNRGINWTRDFRYNGKKFVHPTHYEWWSTIQANHRYWWGGPSNPYPIMDRITEVPLNINTHSVTWAYEFYGGWDSNPDGTIFPFRPLAWYSYSADIQAAGIRFPQPLHQPVTWFFDQYIGIEDWAVQDSAWSWTYQFYNTWKWRKYKNPKKSRFWIMLMIDNPDYEWPWDTQNARKIVASNMVVFEVTFKVATLIDPVTSIVNKYATDWKINLL